MAHPEVMTFNQLIRDLMKDPDRKPVYKMVEEILYLFFIFGRFPRHYFSRYLFKQGTTNIRDYYPDNYLYYKIKPFYNEEEIRDVLENKLFFSFFYSQFGLPLPKNLMFNHKDVFVIGNKKVIVKTSEDMGDLIQEIFDHSITYNSIIIKKTYWSFGGHSVYKIDRKQYMADNSVVRHLFPQIISSAFLFQETIIQHPDLNILNSSCVNTVRLDTFIDKSGKVEIISGYIRMSVNESCVDNISSGGCQVGIDLETGKLRKYGYQTFRNTGSKVLTKHPFTNIVFENFKIPFFSEAKDIVLSAAGLMPGLRLVGWDIAFGELGPIIVEGNSDYDISGNDLAYGGYRSNPVFRKVLDELKSGR
jgi:hypothetical protein